MCMVYIYAKWYCTTCMSTVVPCVSIYSILLCATRYLQTLITRLTPRPPIQIPILESSGCYMLAYRYSIFDLSHGLFECNRKRRWVVE